MRVPRRLAALVWLVLLGGLAAPSLLGQSVPVTAVESPDRAALVAERYRAMLAANPTEGMALDRLWKYHEDHGSTAALIESYRQTAEAADAQLSALLVYGHLLKKNGRLDEAAKWYQAAAERYAADPLPKISSAMLTDQRGDHESAAKLYAQALDKLPGGDRRRADLLLKEGSAWLAAGKVKEAADAWEKIVALNPTDWAVRRQLADAYEKNGLRERAISQYESIEAHASAAERATALRELGRLREADGQFDAARDALERGLGLTARDNWLHGDLQNRLIRLYQRAGRVPELATRWRSAVEQTPRDLDGYLRLTALAEAEGDVTSERAWLEKVVALAPNDQENVLKLARRLAEAGEIRRAADGYDRLLRQHPGSMDLVLARADLDLQLGQAKEAARRVEARVEASPADESVTTPALNFLLSHHLNEASERMLRAGVARQPTAAEPVLALAKFLFSQRRPEEAGAALTTLTDRPGDNVARARRFALAADVYREGDRSVEAIRCWRAAAVLRPDDPAPLLAAADATKSNGNIPGAVGLLEQAILLAPGETVRLNTEKKLFEALRSDGGEETSVPISPAGSAAAVIPPQTQGSRLDRYLAGLDETAKQEKTAANYLRLARWESWAHHDPKALAAATTAIALDPANLAALELAASVAEGSHQNELAERMLTRMLEVDPGRESAVLSQLAKLKLQEGDSEGSLKLFTRLQQLAPGSRTTLAELALAQQRMDRWFDALRTWEQAYSLPGTTPAQRAETRRPLLAVYEHVGQFTRAVEMLLQAVDEQTDLPAKEDLFRQLADLAYKHELGKPLRTQFEERLQRKPDDYFTLAALAQLDREAGEPEEAYRLLQRAHYSSPDPVRSLRALVQEADELGKTDEAVAHLQRLTALPGQFTADNLEKLAELQEENQDPAAAARTWSLAVARFPRDPAALGKATEYFERSDRLDLATGLQRQIVALDGADLPRTLRLAELESRAGDASEALHDYAAILAGTRSETAGEPWSPPDELVVPDHPMASVFPGVGRGRFRGEVAGGVKSHASPTPKSTDQALRLQTIAEMSRLLFTKREGPPLPPTSEQSAWLKRWQDAADAGLHAEPLQAFYFANRKEETMRLLSKWLESSTSDDRLIRPTFLAAGLRMGDYETLGRWTWSAKDPAEQTNRAEALAAALDHFLSAGGKPGSTIVADLFPAEATRWDLLWESAKEFATLHWYAPAGELGLRVLNLLPSARATYALEVAEWDLYAGSVPPARQALAVAVEEGGGWTLDANVSPDFSALREYYLLLPEEERPSFTADYLQRTRARSNKPHTLLASVLLHGLAGEAEKAQRDLDALLAARMLAGESSGPSPDARRWAYLLANGAQLQSWNLDSLAVYLWRHALMEASTFDEHFGDAGGMVTEIRRRLLAAEVALADDPEDARKAVADYLDTVPPTGTAASIAGEMRNNARYSAAIQIDEYLCRVEPNNGEHWRSLISAYEAAGDFDGLERLFEGLFRDGATLPETLPRTDFVCRWAAVRERNGDADGACRVLEQERSNVPGALQVLVQLAQTYDRSGRDEQAAGVWREMLPLDGSDAALLGLANLEERRGRREEAIKLLQGGLTRGAVAGQDEAASRLTQLYLAANRVDDARQLAQTLAREGKYEALPNIASDLARSGQHGIARELLTAAVRRVHEPNLRFRLQQTLVGLSPASGDDLRGFLIGMKRLETLARDMPTARNSWEAIRYKLARQAGADAWLEQELARRWDGGRGDYNAGERLAALCIETRQDDRLRETITAFDHRPLLPDQLLFGLENALVQAGHASLALPISERLCRRFPQNIDYALGRATVLWKSERHEEACRLLERVEAGAVLRDDVTERVALVYLGLGAKEHAQATFEGVVQSDPAAVRSPGSFLQLARLYSDEGRGREAASLLRVAYRQDACDDFHPLVQALAASGQLEGSRALEMPAADFPLSFHRRARLLGAVYDFLIQQARVSEARSLWLKYPEFLADNPGSAADLCRDLPMPELPGCVQALQTAADQFFNPLPRLIRLLEAAKVRSRSDR